MKKNTPIDSEFHTKLISKKKDFVPKVDLYLQNLILVRTVEKSEILEIPSY